LQGISFITDVALVDLYCFWSLTAGQVYNGAELS